MKILFYPDIPLRFIKWENKVSKYCRIAGIKKTNSVKDNYDAVIFWTYNHSMWERDLRYYGLAQDNFIINAGCYDSTKMHNEICMKAAFGYNTLVDDSYDGIILKKSNYQCAHYMVEVDKVGINDDDYIYVRQVDNTSGNFVVDYRIFVFGDEIPIVVRKVRPLKDRYGGANESGLDVFRAPHILFGPDEINSILEYCYYYGSQITELDAIRDEDGTLYIVDNNNIAGLSKSFNRLLTKENLWPELSDMFKSTVIELST